MTAFRSLARLNRGIPACTRCPRLRAHCRRVARVKKRAFRHLDYWGKPVPGFGDPDARLLIVGLAPAAHGANRTGRMFTGDSSGSWLYEALFRFGFANQPLATDRADGLALEDCYISAAARCAPPANKPTREELAQCRSFLEDEVRLLGNVAVVVVLGRIGWEAWLRAAGWWTAVAPGRRPLFGHNLQTVLPDETVLIASYHPSRQNTNTGRLTRTMWYDVFAAARNVVDRTRSGPSR